MGLPEGAISVRWGKPDRHSEPSLVYSWGGGNGTKAAARIISYAIENKRFAPNFDGTCAVEPSLVEELEARGFDLTTLRISIKMKREARNDAP